MRTLSPRRRTNRENPLEIPCDKHDPITTVQEHGIYQILWANSSHAIGQKTQPTITENAKQRPPGTTPPPQRMETHTRTTKMVEGAPGKDKGEWEEDMADLQGEVDSRIV